MAVKRTHIRVSEKSAKLLKMITETKEDKTQIMVLDEILEKVASKIKK